jgi:hypothetical protein
MITTTTKLNTYVYVDLSMGGSSGLGGVSMDVSGLTTGIVSINGDDVDDVGDVDDVDVAVDILFNLY